MRPASSWNGICGLRVTLTKGSTVPTEARGNEIDTWDTYEPTLTYCERGAPVDSGRTLSPWWSVRLLP